VINSSHQPCHNEDEQKGIVFLVDNGTSISTRGSKVCHKRGVPGKVSEVGHKIGSGGVVLFLDVRCRGVACGPTLTLVTPVELLCFLHTGGCCFPCVTVSTSWVDTLGLKLPSVTMLFLGGSDFGHFSLLQLWTGHFVVSQFSTMMQLRSLVEDGAVSDQRDIT
jgi:hypothetical protein